MLVKPRKDRVPQFVFNVYFLTTFMDNYVLRKNLMFLIST